MYYCNKCGEKINDPTKPCSTCGLVLNGNNNVNNNSYSKNKKYPINVFVFIFGFLIIIISAGFVQKSFFSAMISYNAVNYSLNYDNIVWSEHDVNDDYYALVNNNDKTTFLQFPVAAKELGVSLDNEEAMEYLYQSYLYALKNSTEFSYNNIGSKIELFDGTNYYYLTADYVSYTSEEVRGKLYILLNEDGKAINILLNLGNYDLIEIEDDIFKVLKSIDM